MDFQFFCNLSLSLFQHFWKLSIQLQTHWKPNVAVQWLVLLPHIHEADLQLSARILDALAGFRALIILSRTCCHIGLKDSFNNQTANPSPYCNGLKDSFDNQIIDRPLYFNNKIINRSFALEKQFRKRVTKCIALMRGLLFPTLFNDVPWILHVQSIKRDDYERYIERMQKRAAVPHFNNITLHNKKYLKEINEKTIAKIHENNLINSDIYQNNKNHVVYKKIGIMHKQL